MAHDVEHYTELKVKSYKGYPAAKADRKKLFAPIALAAYGLYASIESYRQHIRSAKEKKKVIRTYRLYK